MHTHRHTDVGMYVLGIGTILKIAPAPKILFHFPEFDKKNQNSVCSPNRGIYVSIYVPAHNKQML